MIEEGRKEGMEGSRKEGRKGWREGRKGEVKLLRLSLSSCMLELPNIPGPYHPAYCVVCGIFPTPSPSYYLIYGCPPPSYCVV